MLTQPSGLPETETPIIIKEHQLGIPAKLALNGIAARATKLETGGGHVYVRDEVRARTEKILRNLGIEIVPGKKV